MKSVDREIKQLLDRMEARHVCEVGVYLPQVSKALQFAGPSARLTLVEPHPDAAARLEEAVRGRPHARVYQKAVASKAGAIELVEAAASTFVRGVRSPASMNGAAATAAAAIHRVEAVPFDTIDCGDIDAIFIDTEGSEWAVLQKMVSRPKVLVIELYGRRYTNPHLAEIWQWTRRNGYRPYAMDKSDVVFLLRSCGKPGALQRLRFKVRLTRAALRRWRYAVIDGLRGRAIA